MTATPTPTRRRRRLHTRLAAAAVVAPLALALTACGDDDDDDVDLSSSAPAQTTDSAPAESPSPSTSTSTSDDDTASQGATATGGDLLTAATTALAAVDGTLFSIDRDDTGWDVTIVTSDGTEQDLDISADGASVTRGPVADNDDDADDRSEREQLLGASVDYEAAVSAADASSTAGATVTGASLDLENGTAEWDVTYDEDTAAELTVTVDASSGEVTRTENDD